MAGLQQVASQPSNTVEQGPASQLKDLLQSSSHTTPVWLNPERFLQPDFDAEEVVLDLRRYVPLAALHDELESYLGLLKAKLVEVINEDYGDYVSLSSRLVNVDGSVMRMRKPLVELKEKLSVVQEAVKAELTALNQGLKRRKEVATARSLLELLQELSHVASKVEKLLAEVAAAHASGTPDLEAHSTLLERVAGEVSRLTFQANRGKDLTFVRAMEPRVAAYRSELESRLSATLDAALQQLALQQQSEPSERQAVQQSTSAVLHCLRAYVELGEAAPAERALRKVVVAPLVGQLVAKHKGQQHGKAAPGEALSELLTSILEAVQRACAPVLSAGLEQQGALRIFDFLGNTVLEEVQATLAAELPGMFSPGVPPAFHANYRSAMRFLTGLEALCQGHAALDRLRASSAYSTFLKRWNLSVYFSLLYQDIAGELEDALAAPRFELLDSSAPGPHSAQGVALPATAALLRCLQRAVSPEVFLLPLADRFLRLVLQSVQRYVTWVQQALAVRNSGAAAQGPGVGATPAGEQLQQQGSFGSVASPGAGQAAAGAPGTPGAPPAWVAQLATEDLAVLHQDLLATSRFVSGTIAPALAARVAELPADARDSTAAALEAACTSMRTEAAVLLTCMASEVGERCLAVVKQLKGITATYRMTTKGPPTRHSHYVMGVLAPLKAVLDSERGKGALQAEAAGQLVAAVAELVNGRYLGLADELLRSVRKTEESLKRLKKAAADGAGDGMSDSDKIQLQLYLDVKEYGNQLGLLGLEAAAMPSYQRLLESVTPSAATPPKPAQA